LLLYRFDRSSDEPHLCGADATGSRRVHDGWCGTDELDLPRALEDRLFRHQLAATRDVTETHVRAV
jgi:hypothetical protein